MALPYAFTFWQAAGETPGYIELCLRSQRRNLPAGFEHVHLDAESAKEWVPEHDLLWEMSVPADDGNSLSLEGRRIAIFTGMLRVALIHRHGGLWVDADTLVFPQLRLLADLIDDFDVVCGEAATGSLGNAVLGGRAGSPFFEQYWTMILTRIEQKRGQEKPGALWGEFGFRMAREVFLDCGGAGAWVAPWGVLNTIDHALPRPTFEQGTTIAEAIAPTALGLSIFNNGTSADLRARSVDRLLADETLFATAYRVAMGEVDSPHLSIRDGAQLRALNRANVTHRLLVDADRSATHSARLREQRDKLRARVEKRDAQRDGLKERLRERNIELQDVQARLAKHTTELRETQARLKERNEQVRRLQVRVAELERPFPRLRAIVRRARRRAGRPA